MAKKPTTQAFFSKPPQISLAEKAVSILGAREMARNAFHCHDSEWKGLLLAARDSAASTRMLKAIEEGMKVPFHPPEAQTKPPEKRSRTDWVNEQFPSLLDETDSLSPERPEQPAPKKARVHFSEGTTEPPPRPTSVLETASPVAQSKRAQKRLRKMQREAEKKRTGGADLAKEIGEVDNA